MRAPGEGQSPDGLPSRPRDALVTEFAEAQLELERIEAQRIAAKTRIAAIQSKLAALDATPPRLAREPLPGLGPRTPADKVTLFRQLTAIPATDERLLLATGRYIGEGFDDPRLDTLFLALPISWKGTLVQYTGRLHRLHPGKRDLHIFDYVDREVPMLLRMFEKRLRGYRAIGYARGEAPLGYAEPADEATVEYDNDVLAELDRIDDVA